MKKTPLRIGFYRQNKKITPAPFSLKKSVLLMGCALAVLHAPAHAQEITGTAIGTPTIITDNTAVTDTTQAANQYGLIDADGGTFNVPSITVGVNDGTARTTFISVIDSVGGGETVTIDGDFTMTTGATNKDSLVLYIGSSDLGTSDILSTGIDFNGNIDAGSGLIAIQTAEATNADAITFSGTSYDLGAGGLILLRGANDTITFDGSSAQSFTGNINGIGGTGDITVNNASGVTFNGTLQNIDTLTIAGSGTNSAATFTGLTDFVNGATLGDGAGSDTNTLTFDTSGGDFSFVGDITGTANDTDNVVITGGNTLTEGGYDYNIDNLTVSGTGTVADLLVNTMHTISDTVTIGSGATLSLKGDLSAGTGIVNSGTLKLDTGGAASVDITGDVSGSGAIIVDNDGSFTGDVAASTVTIDSTMTLATSGAGKTYNVGTTTLDTASEISFSNNNIIGDIVTATSGQGTVTVTDAAVTQTITGDIGTSSKILSLLRIQDGGTLANIVQTTGNLYTLGISVGATDTLQFTGNAAQTVVGGINGGGTVTVGNGTSTSNVTFNSILSTLVGFNVMDNAAATLLKNTTITGNLSVDGNLTLGQGFNYTVADVIAGSAQGKIFLTVGTDSNGNDKSATLKDTGGALDFANLDGTNANTATLTLKPGTGVVTIGQEFLIIDGATTVTNFTNGASIADDFALFDFTLSDGATATLGTDNSDIVATAKLVDLAAVTNSDTNADTLDAFLNGVTPAQFAADPVLESVYNGVLSNPDPDEAAESIQAAVDGGMIVAASNFAAANNNINNAQLAAMRTDSGMTGMSAGDVFVGARAWTQAFGRTAEQDKRDNVDGFDLDTYGVAFGMDKEMNALTLGAAFSYGDSAVDSNNATTTRTEIDSYQFSIYGDYDLDQNTYVSGSVYYAYHDIETTRHNVGGVSGVNAVGDFSANQFGGYVEIGRDYVHKGLLLTPKLLSNVSNYQGDSYTETGAGGASLNVDPDSVSIFELGAGLDVVYTKEQLNGAILETALNLEYRYDFVGEEVVSSSSFTGGGSSFQTQGFDPAQHSASIGFGLTYYSADSWQVAANYDYDFKDDYDSHTGFIKVTYEF